MKTTDKVTVLKGIGLKKAEVLAAGGIETLSDFLNFFPRSYEDRRTVTTISDLTAGKDALISGTVISKRYSGSPYKKNTPLSLLICDETGTIEVVFFNGRYIANLFQMNEEYTFYGRVSESFDRRQMIHPEFHRAGDPTDLRGIIPVYPQIAGMSQNEIRKIQQQLRILYPELKEWLPEALVRENRLASPSFATQNIHFPKDGNHMRQAKFRLIFDELLTLETGLFYIRNDRGHHGEGIVIDADAADVFIAGLPFSLTEGQKQAWEDIKRDLAAVKSMNRLMQGDVGSGKTVIAEMAMFSAAKSGYQSVMMAPTELLAKQHLASLTRDFEAYGINVGLLCSSMKAVEKRETLRQLAEGEIQILVGTHAVIQPDVIFKNLGMVITDEQHRFGVNQRNLLSRKGENPNVLVMTATPIPRTLAVILYGDLDISQIRTMPSGRIPIKTYMADQDNRGRVYEQFLKEQLSQGRQAYVVAPLIEESQKIDAKSAEELFEELSQKLKNYKVALVHGAMKQEQKDSVMSSFAKGEIDVLVSTVVIEVGINVPNASVMIIENSERFGLAQLHQLRGRVGRGKYQSYCYLICQSESETSKERSKILCQTTDGFEIAEADLRLRGPGEIFGTQQHGLPEMHLSDLVRHGDVLEKAKNAAREILEADPDLSTEAFAELKRRIQKMFGRDIRLEL